MKMRNYECDHANKIDSTEKALGKESDIELAQ